MYVCVYQYYSIAARRRFDKRDQFGLVCAVDESLRAILNGRSYQHAVRLQIHPILARILLIV